MTTTFGPNPFELLFSLLRQILDAVAHITDRIDSVLRTSDDRDPTAHALHADYVYAPEEAARFLGLKRSTYNRLTEVDLPKLRSGRARGVDLMAYRGDITQAEAAALGAAWHEAGGEGAARPHGPGGPWVLLRSSYGGGFVEVVPRGQEDEYVVRVAKDGALSFRSLLRLRRDGVWSYATQG